MEDHMEKPFEAVRERLDALEDEYNRGGGNLHFEGPARVDEALFEALLALARESLEIVRAHRGYFSTHALYDDGMVWYDLFLFVGAAASKLRSAGLKEAVSPATVAGLAEVLVDISEFSTVHPGDILKRNFEALGNTLLAFPGSSLVDRVRARGLEGNRPAVAEFVAETLAAVHRRLGEQD